MRRMGLDQTTAWMLAVFLAAVTFGGLYGVAKLGATDGEHEEGSHGTGHGSTREEGSSGGGEGHRVEADDPAPAHGETAHGAAAGAHDAPAASPAAEHAPAGHESKDHASPPPTAHGEKAPADKHHK